MLAFCVASISDYGMVGVVMRVVAWVLGLGLGYMPTCSC